MGQDADTWIFDEGDSQATAAPDGLSFVDRYERVEQIGQGGVGTVWRVWDALLQRHVAMKVLREDRRDPDSTRRFVVEARLTGALEHPGIVAVHDVGVDEGGRPFFTMEEVRGTSLRDLIRAPSDGGDEISRRMRLLVRVCEALAFAHDAGVVHRDVKPHNIMVGAFGEVRLMDWGLAARLDDDGTDLPGGTPAYMAPEQLQQRGRPGSTSPDVFGLGCVLWECLTGERAFASPGDGESLSTWSKTRAVRRPSALSVPQRKAPRDLLRVAERAMAQDPADRHESVLALQEDLEAWLAGRPVATVRYGGHELAGKWLRRNQAAIRGGGFVALVATFVLSYGLTRYVRDTHTQAERARVAEQLAQSQAVSAELAAGQGFLASGDQLTARTRFRTALGRSDPNSADGIAARLGLWATHARAVSPFATVQVRPGAALAARDDGAALLVTEGDTVQLVELPSARASLRWTLPGPVRAVEFRADRPIAWVEAGDVLSAWALDDEPVALAAPAIPVDSAAVSVLPRADGVLVRRNAVDTVGLLHGVASVWSLGAAHTAWFDEHFVVAGGYQRPTVLFDRGTTRAVREICPASCPGQVTPDGALLVYYAELEYELRAEDPRTGARRWAQEARNIEALDLSPDGRRLVVGTLDGRVVERDVATGRVIAELQGHEAAVVQVIAGDAVTITADASGRVLAWGTGPGPHPPRLIERDSTTGASLSPDRRLLLLSQAHQATVYDRASGLPLWVLPRAGDRVWGQAIADDGTVYEGRPGQGVARRTPAGAETLVIDAPAVAVEVLPDGALFVGEKDGGFAVWEADGALRWRGAEPVGVPAWSVDADPRAGLVAVAGFSPASVALFDLQTGAERMRATLADVDGVYGIDMVPGGDGVLVGARDGSVRWIGPDGQERRRFAGGLDGPVLSVAWGATRGLVAAGGFDGTVALYAAEGELLATDQEHGSSVAALEWLPAGQLLGVGTQGPVLVRDLDLDDRLRTARAELDGSGELPRDEALRRFGLLSMTAALGDGDERPPGGWLNRASAELWLGRWDRARADLGRARAADEAPAVYLDLLDRVAAEDASLAGIGP
ncbi:MAG: protein kinase [Alphaproteobacteria bacterium]|nr:protein kinase [Alphaproteobacteria bacterium]